MDCLRPIPYNDQGLKPGWYFRLPAPTERDKLMPPHISLKCLDCAITMELHPYPYHPVGYWIELWQVAHHGHRMDVEVCGLFPMAVEETASGDEAVWMKEIMDRLSALVQAQVA